jgi:exonuclease SbcD
MIVGNHDLPVGFGKASSVEIFDTLNTPNVYIVEEPKILRIKTKEGEVQIACIPWTTRALFLGRECRALSDDEANEKIRKVCSELIKNFTNKLDPSIPSVLACHLAVSEAVYSGGERLAMIGKEPTIPKEVLARSAFDYVCLGHIHKHQNLNPDSHPPIVYCGSIERVDFGEEKEEKGFCIVTLNGKDTSYKFIKTPARPFHTINVSTEGGNPTECIIRELKKHDLAGAIVKIFYTTSNEGDSINHTEIKLALKDAFLLAGIFRKTHVERKRRPHISEDLRMIDALDRYIKANPSLNRIERELKATALALERELEAKDDSS